MTFLEKIPKKILENVPTVLSIPLSYTPFLVKKHLLETWLKWQLKQSLQNGDLDFLHNNWLKIEITDLRFSWFVSVIDDTLIVKEYETADVIFRGASKDFLLIATRREDPDTLFFQRKLSIEGDTELGLYIKNLLDSLDFDEIPDFLKKRMNELLDALQD